MANAVKMGLMLLAPSSSGNKMKTKAAASSADVRL